MNNFFSAKNALADYRANKNIWSGGALIVATEGSGFQAIPGAPTSGTSAIKDLALHCPSLWFARLLKRRVNAHHPNRYIPLLDGI